MADRKEVDRVPLTNEQTQEVREQKSRSFTTRRTVSEGLEEQLYEAHPVLDHGFVRVIDYMGNDEAIVQAARVSYGAGTKKLRNDQGLIRYLMRNDHTTPFEMCEIKLHVKLPIFVARQWIRHRTANVNEYSARYSVLDREFYIPDGETLASQSNSNRQGREQSLPSAEAEQAISIFRNDSARAYDHYQELLSDEGKQGLARELARINLPQNIYTQWYWKIDLNNLFRFVALRSDDHAQYEIRAYALEIARLVKLWVPIAWRAFEDCKLGGKTWTSSQMECVRRKLRGEPVEFENSNLSKRDWEEIAELWRDK